MTQSWPPSPGLAALRAGAVLERKSAAPADERRPEADTGQAAPPEKPAAPATREDTGGGRWPWQRRQEQQAPPWRVEGLDDHDQKKKENDGGGRAWFWWTLLGLLLLNWILTSALVGASRPTVPYTFFLGQVSAGNIQQVNSTGNTIQGTFKHEVRYPAGKNAHQVMAFTTERPTYANDQLFQRLQANGVTVTAKPPSQGTPLWADLLLWFGPALLLGGLLAWWMRRGGGTAGLTGFGGMGQSKARRYDPESGQRTTFADVAGIDEVKDEVWEIVDFLRNPDRYRRLGARIPHGVLLSGEPGTGKTLLARAVAGEAEVPFFSISASEFVEMIVGVGASRVRDLFDQAKKVAPSIIFIDELDAIGRARGSSSSGGRNDEQEQTLNQILTEMDGFTGEEGVVVLAATNRPDVLDPALLRPGRFDRRITISAPDLAGRRQILAVHTRGVPLDPAVNLDALAGATPGMVGADLANLVNEAALLAARRDHHQVTTADFSDSLEKIYLGTTRGIVLSSQERERTAFHESGHALLGMLTPGADPVRKISIIPRGQALGVTFQAPEADRYDYSETYLRGRITGALGGRAAEEIIYGDVTTGAENDMEHASGIARQMVGRWGMSPAIGPVTVLPSSSEQSPYGYDGVAPATKELVDTEARRIMEDCYQQAITTLNGHRDQLDRLAHTLLQRETLDEDEAYAAAGIDRGTAPAAVARAEAASTGAASPGTASTGTASTGPAVDGSRPAVR